MLTVNGGSGSGSYPVGHDGQGGANAPPAGQVFAGWTGETVILADQDPSRASTTARMPSIDVAITATYVPRARACADNTTTTAVVRRIRWPIRSRVRRRLRARMHGGFRLGHRLAGLLGELG